MVPGGAGVEAAPCLGVAFLGVAQGPLGSVQEKLHNLTISKGFLIRIYIPKGVVISLPEDKLCHKKQVPGYPKDMALHAPPQTHDNAGTAEVGAPGRKQGVSSPFGGELCYRTPPDHTQGPPLSPRASSGAGQPGPWGTRRAQVPQGTHSVERVVERVLAWGSEHPGHSLSASPSASQLTSLDFSVSNQKTVNN